MKKLLLLLCFLVFAFSARADESYFNYCTVGNTPAKVSGLHSTNTFQGSYPKCTVNVYAHGTTNHVQLYSDNGVTALSNPFTANSDGSYNFYAVDGNYDVTMSGGLNGGFPIPVTIPNISLNSGGSGAQPTILVNGAVVPPNIYNFVNGTNATVTNPTGGTIQINSTGGGGNCGSNFIPCLNTPNTWLTGIQTFQSSGVSNIPIVVQGAGGGVTTPSFVQGTSTPVGGEPFFGCNGTLPGVTAGNSIIAIAWTVKTGGTPPTISNDSQGNAYTQIAFDPTTSITVFISTNVVGGDTTITMDGTGEVSACEELEYSGIASTSPFDGVSYQGSIAPITIGPTTTTNPTDVLISSIHTTTSTGVITPTGYTLNLSGIPSSGGFDWTASLAVTGAGSYSTSWNGAGGSGVLLALKAGGSLYQTADLVQYQDSSGTVHGSVNALGQPVLPSYPSGPGNTPTGPALAYNAGSNCPEFYNVGSSAWDSLCGTGGVNSINSTTGSFTFNFSAGAGSCSGTTCSFTGASGGLTALNSLTGSVNLVAGSGITITPSGSNITITGGGGGGSVGPGTGGVYPIFNGSGVSTTIGNGHLNENTTTGQVTSSLPFAVNDSSGTGGTFSGLEGTAPACAANRDVFWSDSSRHRLAVCNNGTAAATVATLSDLATSSAFGVAKCDGTTITCAGGVFTAIGGGGGGSGTVTNFSSGSLSPLFTSSVATSTTTPALTFSLSNASAFSVFGNFTGSSAPPTFNASGGGTTNFLRADGTWAVPTLGVTSVGLTVPSYLSVSGSPVTGSGTLAVTGTSETANFFLAAPNGSAGALSPRAIAVADIPTLNQNTTGTSGGLSGTPNISVANFANSGTVTMTGLESGSGSSCLHISNTTGAVSNFGADCGSGGGGVTSINTSTGAFTFSGSGVSCSGTTCTFTGAGSGIGSITWALPSFLTASPTTISATGTQTFSLASQTANTFFAAPNGSSGSPTFRALVAADVPTLNQSTTGTAAGLSGSPAITVSSATVTGLTSGGCVQASTGGLLTTTGSTPCGSGGGTPGGTTGAIQFNNTGAFAGLSGTGVVMANGASTPTILTNTGTGNNVLATAPTITLPNATGLPLTSGVTGILPSANGGTANGFFTVSGPASSAKTFTFPNASATVLTSNALVTVAQGGTGVATITGPIKGNGTSPVSAAAAADIYALWSGTCSSSTFLRGDGSCAAAPGGVSSVANSDSSLTISPTTGSVVASINLTHANVFTAGQSAPTFTTTGTTNGAINLTSNASAATAPGANTAQITVPNSVTAYAVQLPGAAPTSANAHFTCTAANPAVCSWSYQGQATLSGGTVTVTVPAVSSSSIILLTHGTASGTIGILSVGTITTNTSFVINSSSSSDTSKINWSIQ